MPPPARPQRLGPYDVVAKIAGGGMATIYLGRGRDATGAEIVAAIKVIRHDLSRNDEVVRMFLDEAKTLSRLSHPNITRTLEYGVSADQHFIAMELLLGRTLADVWDTCRERKLALRMDMSAYIAARVADALSYAHELEGEDGQRLNLIHRDVNPSNIFLTYDGQIKLFDFGLAKALGRRAKSGEGIVKGKLPYLAPEAVMQFPIDSRADIFTLGATLWEMTTMRRLFKRDSDVETVKAVRTSPIPDPKRSVPSYPDELARVVKRALERNRDHRYQSASELATDLDAFVATCGKNDMPQMIDGILDTLFVGERDRQMGWLRTTTALSPDSRRGTIAPPVPISARGAPPPSRK